MITSLFDYIGLLGVTTPQSGVYLNRLQGIETSQLDLIRKEETYDIEDAWDDIQNRAIDEFERRLNVWGQRFFQNQSYILNVLTGQYDEDNAVPSTDSYAGWTFDGSFGYYKNLMLQIPEVHIYSTNTANSSIRIFNAATGDLLDSIPFTAIANEVNRVYIGKSYPAWKFPRIFIAYDESEINTIRASDLPFNSTFSVSEGRISKSAIPKHDNIGGVGTQGQGLIVTYSLDCSLDNWVSQRIDLFRSPFLYLLGFEFCQERLYSDRINRYTLLRIDRAKELSDYFLERFNEELEGILKSLTINYNYDFCFQCDREVNYRYMVP